MAISNSVNWQIESIRVTAFVNGQLNPGILESWLEHVSENSPSQVSKTPSSFTGISRSTEGFLRMNWTDNRLDVTLSSDDPQSSQTIGLISDATPLFNRFVDRIPEIDELALIDRIALGLVLTAQVTNEAEGIEILSHSIVGLNLSPSARDFLYRVNHPHESQIINGLKLNWLATWSIGQVQLIQVRINPDGSQVHQTISEGHLAIRLELDINTDKAVQLGADKELLRRLLSELEAITITVACGGEVTMR